MAMKRTVLGMIGMALTGALFLACGGDDGDTKNASGSGASGGSSGSGASGGSGGDGGAAAGGAGGTASGGDGGQGAQGGGGSGGMPANEADIVRDEYGVPHIFAASNRTGFYALGYATAQDRLFQMHHSRSYVRGTLSEYFAVPPAAGSAGDDAREFNAKLLKHDRKMRYVGFARYAEASWNKLPNDVPELLQAYADGVNAYLNSSEFVLPPAFVAAGLTDVPPWTPADSLLAWQRVGMIAGAPDLGNEILKMNDCADGTCTPPTCDRPLDEDAAIVQKPIDGIWPPGGSQHLPGGILGHFAPTEVPVKFSHAFVVGGSNTTTGKPVLFAEPKLAITAPNPWYQYHLNTPEMDARGVGWAGAPGMFIFWNRHVSQTITAGGGDVSDLFELTPGGAPGTYELDGVDTPFQTVQETIKVRHGADVVETVRSTVFGPVVTDVLTKTPDSGGDFALSYIEHLDDTRHSIVAGIELMRAESYADYHAALDYWSVPTVNALYAGVDKAEPTSSGHIAYHALAGIAQRAPVMVNGEDLRGQHPADGSKAANAWAGKYDINYNPHVVDPVGDVILNGNSIGVGAWYHEQLYTGILGTGDSFRSLQLRYKLGDLLASAKASPAQLHALHLDAGSVAIELYRDILRLLSDRGLLKLPTGNAAPSRFEKAALALAVIDGWLAEGGQLEHSSKYYRLVSRLPGFMTGTSRYWANPDFSCRFHEAEGGVSFMLKQFDKDPSIVDAVVTDFVIDVAERAWDDLVTKEPGTSSDLSTWTGGVPLDYAVRYQIDLDCLQPGHGSKSCSFDPSNDLSVPIERSHTATIGDPKNSSFPATVDFAAIDEARAATFPGNNENPDSAHYDDLVPALVSIAKGDDEFPVTPLDRNLIDAKSTVTLTYP